ncbi:universal stress protein [Streptomyces sp. NBC_00063]|uniref:universal stress protein n=1 Tax=Streptomyces sp. NBC_00063 TaxID=2975638 RepID=UPI003D71055A
MATTHITAGLDGSRASATAARWAAREAELRGIALNLFHVDERPDQRPLPPVPCPENTRRSVGMLNPWRDKYPSAEVSQTQPLGRAASRYSTPRPTPPWSSSAGASARPPCSAPRCDHPRPSPPPRRPGRCHRPRLRRIQTGPGHVRTAPRTGSRGVADRGRRHRSVHA